MTERPLKVLLVEDDEDDFIITRDLFSEIAHPQFVVEWVDNYELASQRIQAAEHDVYFIDYRLGIHNGLDLLKQAVADGCQAPIILLTGLGDKKVDIEAMKAGAADYLVKGQITTALLERSVNHSLERKHVERRLRESEEQYRLLFDRNPHPIWVVDRLSRKFLAVNQAAIEHYGYSREHFLTMTLEQLLDSSSPSKELSSIDDSSTPDAFLPRGRIWRHKTSAGRIIEVELTWNQISFHGQLAVLVLANDLTQRLDLEAQLRQSQKMESVGTLAGGIAHDFNNILGIISGYSSKLRQKEGQQHDPSLDAIDNAVQRGASVVRQILTFARKTEAALQPIEINAVVEELCKMLSGAFPKNINFVTALCPSLPAITADPTQLHQSLLNLCVNARDAMPGGGVLTLSTSLVDGTVLQAKFSEAQPVPYACLSVSDTGTGMDESTRMRIFEPFFTTKPRDRGSGLGLSVVYGVVKGHQGFIHVESKKGQGTTFEVYLPIPESSGSSTHSRPAERAEIPGGNETILLVEDETLLLELMKSMLEEKGYQVLTAHDGIEAIEVFRSRKDDVALLLVDMGLPKLSGWEAFLQMRQLNPQLRAIVASGYLEPDLRNNILKSGARDFIEKPYVPQEIFRRVRRILDSPN